MAKISDNGMNRLRVSYAQAVHGGAETQAVLRVLRKHKTILGENVRTFEQRVARLFGKRHGVMVNSGSSANLLALEILDLPQGSEVITPILTFSTTVAPIVQKRLRPAFVDVEPGTYTANLGQVERLINSKTRALMIPSLLGNVPDLRRLRAVARAHGLYLIEDSCDTLGATYRGRPTGIYSDVSTTSFYGSHIITAGGGGGMVCVNRRRWDRRLRVLRGWGRSSAVSESEDMRVRYRCQLDGVPYDSKYLFEAIGYNFLPLEIGAAFGVAQLRRLGSFARIRSHNFRTLLGFFKKYEEFFVLPKKLQGTRTNWLAFPLTIRERVPFSRLELVSHLEANNIQTRPIFTGNVLRQPAFGGIRRRVLAGGYPEADWIMRHGLVVGCHHGLGRRELDKLVDVFGRFLKRF